MSMVAIVVFLIFHLSAHTQNTATARINAMLTENINSRKAEYFDISGTDMEPQHELESSSSSSDGQNYRRNHIHIDDYFNSIRDLKNESMLRGMETERRNQEIIENNARMFREDLFIIHGETELHNMQQQDIIDYYVNPHIHVPPPLPPPLPFTDKAENRYFPKTLKILLCNNIYKQLRCPSNQGNHVLHLHQTMPQNQLMRKKVLWDDLETIMEYKQNHEQILFIGKHSQPSSLEHNYQIEEGENLIFNTLQPKVQLQSD